MWTRSLEVTFDPLEAIGDLVGKVKVESFGFHHVPNGCQEHYMCQ